jgi:hypothetical protein
MGASSVTGVGLGSATNSGLKGPSNGRNFFVPQLCPHVVMAGEVVTAHATDQYAGQATVYFPEGPLPKSETEYVVMLTPFTRDELDIRATAWYVVKNDDTNDQFDHFDIYSTISGSTGQVGRFMYEVLTVGFGLDIVKDNPNTP